MRRVSVRSYHLFYAGEIDDLVLQFVEPVAETIVTDGLASGYFFIRYWNGGPHVRLRLFGVADELLADQLIESGFAEFASSSGVEPMSASTYSEGAQRMMRAKLDLGSQRGGALDRETVEELQATPGVQIREYAFEAERYGGIATRSALERHYRASTAISLAMVRASRCRPVAKLTLGVHLAVETAKRLCLDNAKSAVLYDDLSRGLSAFHRADRESTFTVMGLEVPNVDGEITKPFVDHIKSGIEGGEQASGMVEVLEEWGREVEQLKCDLSLLRDRDQLSVSPAGTVLDCLHLLNNRIGNGIVAEHYGYYLASLAFAAAETA
jgi:hypothetical protein